MNEEKTSTINSSSINYEAINKTIQNLSSLRSTPNLEESIEFLEKKNKEHDKYMEKDFSIYKAKIDELIKTHEKFITTMTINLENTIESYERAENLTKELHSTEEKIGTIEEPKKKINPKEEVTFTANMVTGVYTVLQGGVIIGFASSSSVAKFLGIDQEELKDQKGFFKNFSSRQMIFKKKKRPEIEIIIVPNDNIEEETKVLEKLKSIRITEWNNVPVELLEKEKEQGLVEYIHVSHSDDKYIGYVEHLYTNKDKTLENKIESIEFDENKYPKILPKEIEIDSNHNLEVKERLLNIVTYHYDPAGNTYYDSISKKKDGIYSYIFIPREFYIIENITYQVKLEEMNASKITEND